MLDYAERKKECHREYLDSYLKYFPIDFSPRGFKNFVAILRYISKVSNYNEDHDVMIHDGYILQPLDEYRLIEINMASYFGTKRKIMMGRIKQIVDSLYVFVKQKKPMRLSLIDEDGKAHYVFHDVPEESRLHIPVAYPFFMVAGEYENKLPNEIYQMRGKKIFSKKLEKEHVEIMRAFCKAYGRSLVVISCYSGIAVFKLFSGFVKKLRPSNIHNRAYLRLFSCESNPEFDGLSLIMSPRFFPISNSWIYFELNESTVSQYHCECRFIHTLNDIPIITWYRNYPELMYRTGAYHNSRMIRRLNRK